MIYELKRGRPTYPQILSDDSEGSPIPGPRCPAWSSFPGGDSLLAVWDSAYSESNIFRIDAPERPAVITDVLTLQGGRGNYDPEGIAIAPDQTLWIASEGNASDSVPNLLVKVGFDGQVLAEIGSAVGDDRLPKGRDRQRRARTLGSGFEGSRRLRSPGSAAPIASSVAQQAVGITTRPDSPACAKTLDDDAGGLNASGEPNRTRIWIYDPKAGTWDHVAWELAPKPTNATWVGLSRLRKCQVGDYI